MKFFKKMAVMGANLAAKFFMTEENVIAAGEKGAEEAFELTVELVEMTETDIDNDMLPGLAAGARKYADLLNEYLANKPEQLDLDNE